MTITIYGASDDLVEVDGCIGADEFSPDGADRWQGDLIAPDGARMVVHCWYDTGGCWHVGVGQTEEDHPLPDWPITISAASPMNPANPSYSALLTIDAPEDTRLRNVKPGRAS